MIISLQLLTLSLAPLPVPAIVKSLAERMKGSVRCENHRDGGALFSLEFPASA